ncbi:phenolic acid decarboxylase [Saccharopolyspora sp. MS10]|uniref:phenolic acid decarboxylase n=1 Tax=Saccharopolyspora sp. MS10 TaxID=3385973 RepID=UPI0039A32ECF
MTTVENPAPAQHLDQIVGKHLIYTYANGWQYEMYVKNDTTIDYRIHSGLVGGRWVKDQEVKLVRVGDDTFKCSWTEPTGTSVSQAINLADDVLHGVIFFPRWVMSYPEKTVCFQNNYLESMQRYRDWGPTYPIYVVDEFAKITFLKDVGLDDETVINCAPGELPEGYAERTNR